MFCYTFSGGSGGSNQGGGAAGGSIWITCDTSKIAGNVQQIYD